MKVKQNIPNFITLLNLATGFVAILLNDPVLSPFLILLASFFDLADGLLARVLNARSALGEQLDALSDLVSFGIAPAYLYYWHMMEEGWISIAFIVLIPVFSALRLGIFNSKESGSDAFSGLPSPSAGLLISFIVYGHHQDVFVMQSQWLFVLVPLVVAMLMISPVRTISLKQIRSKPMMEQYIIGSLAIGVVLLLLVFEWKGVYLSVVLYFILSLLYTVIRKIRSY